MSRPPPLRIYAEPRNSRDGKPFYCVKCGLGWGEYQACEQPDCELESDAAAAARVPPVPPPDGRRLAGRRSARTTLALALCLAATPAIAADDAVCKPYATALMNNLMQWAWTRAYSHCSLLEEASPVPPLTGDWRAALDILEPDPPAPPAPSPKPAPAGDRLARCAAAHPAGYKAGTWNKWTGRKWVRVPC